MANNNSTTTSPELQSTNLVIVIRGEAHSYLYTRITSRCIVLTSMKTGKTAQFHSDETLWAFFAALCKHLQGKNTPNQQKAITDFLKASEDYFKQFSQLVNSKVSHYTRRGMEWNLGDYANNASNAAWRYVTYVSQGI